MRTQSLAPSSTLSPQSDDWSGRCRDAFHQFTAHRCQGHFFHSTSDSIKSIGERWIWIEPYDCVVSHRHCSTSPLPHGSRSPINCGYNLQYVERYQDHPIQSRAMHVHLRDTEPEHMPTIIGGPMNVVRFSSVKSERNQKSHTNPMTIQSHPSAFSPTMSLHIEVFYVRSDFHCSCFVSSSALQELNIRCGTCNHVWEFSTRHSLLWYVDTFRYANEDRSARNQKTVNMSFRVFRARRHDTKQKHWKTCENELEVVCCCGCSWCSETDKESPTTGTNVVPRFYGVVDSVNK